MATGCGIQNIFSGSDLKAIQNTTLADLIAANTGTKNLQNDVFFFRTSISGQVTANNGSPGRPGQNGAISAVASQNGRGLGGILVELVDTSGNIVTSTHTKSDGSYHFAGVGLGTYVVTVVPNASQIAVKTLSQRVSVTKGGPVSGIDFTLGGLLAGLPGSGQNNSPTSGPGGNNNGPSGPGPGRH